MLLVALGLCSASYKAFMALRLKPLVLFLARILLLSCAGAVFSVARSDAQMAGHQTHARQNNAVPTASYVDEPFEQLLEAIPEIRTLQPAQDQTQLRMILEQAGKNVDMEFKDFRDLVAKEIVSEIRANPTTDLSNQGKSTLNDQPNLFQNEYSYFIVREGTLVERRIHEYRRDRYGSDGSKPKTSPVLATVPALTFLSANFASSLIYFSTDLQGEERFRYLGEQHVGERTAYLVAFAQVPGAATVGFTMRAPSGEASNWLVQGIAWIDKSTFEILQMRTDLLARYSLLPPCQTQDQMETLIHFAAVRPNGASDVLWLPTEADVHETAGDCQNPVQIARNVHHFSEYRSYDHEDGNVANPKEMAESAHPPQHLVHPYLELPLPQLMKRIPQLKGISPAPNQEALSMILGQTGKQVDAFFAHLADLIAHEDITQERLVSGTLPGGMPAGTMLAAKQRIQDSYLILRRGGTGPPRIEEFRMDAKGNRVDETTAQNNFFVTSGFALSSIHFATLFQFDSRFLYLGNQKIGGHDTYVVVFSQMPSEARVAVTMRGRDGSNFRLLSQGIAWVDKESFHIRQLRTDLLVPQPEIGLAEQTTIITYSEVRLADAAPLWLPREVDVNIKFTEPPGGGASDLASRLMDQTFRNVHHYSKYSLYRVSTKMVAAH